MIGIPLDFSDVVLTPDVIARWKSMTLDAIFKLHQKCIAITAPTEETLLELPDGRLKMIARFGNHAAIVLQAKPGEWSRVSSN